MSTDLDAALSGEYPQPPETAPEAPETEAAAPETETTPETAQAEPAEAEETTGEKEASPPPGDEVAAFKAKAIDETRKRQAAEQRAAQLERQVAQQPAQAPDFWADPDKALANIAATVDQRLLQANTTMSVNLMRSLHDDYDEMEAAFVDAAEADPSLIYQMNQSGNPGQFAYNWAKQQQQIAQYSDPSYKQKLESEMREKIRAELEAEQQAKVDAAVNQRLSLPGSIANDRAAGGTSVPTDARPDLNQLIGN